jgi:hypothetical protein
MWYCLRWFGDGGECDVVGGGLVMGMSVIQYRGRLAGGLVTGKRGGAHPQVRGLGRRPATAASRRPRQRRRGWRLASGVGPHDCSYFTVFLQVICSSFAADLKVFPLLPPIL